jgi:hypothetical protein
VDRTIDTSAVVTPNCAIDSRSQIISYKMLQNPEMKKNTKNQIIATAAVMCLIEDDCPRTSHSL